MKPTSGRLRVRPDQHVEFQRQRNNTDYIAFALIGALAGIGISVDLKRLLITGRSRLCSVCPTLSFNFSVHSVLKSDTIGQFLKECSGNYVEYKQSQF